MVKNKRFSTSKKRGTRLFLIIILVAGALFLGTLFTLNGNYFGKQNSTPVVNQSSPTEVDIRESEDNKDRLSAEAAKPEDTAQTDEPVSSSGKKAVEPTITEATRSSIKAYVLGIFEEGGTCTATFASGSKTLIKTSEGFQNASYTQCAPIAIEEGFLDSSSWSVTVSYSSATSEGASEPVNLLWE